MALQSVTWRSAIQQTILDPVSGRLMTTAVILDPCGHTINEDTALKCRGLCPIDNKLFQKYIPNYNVRDLAIAATELPPSDRLILEKGKEEICLNRQKYNELYTTGVCYTVEEVKNTTPSKPYYADIPVTPNESGTSLFEAAIPVTPNESSTSLLKRRMEEASKNLGFF